MNEHVVKMGRSRWRLLLTAATFLALAILIYSVRGQVADVISNLGKVNAWALVLILPIEALNADAYTRFYRSFFAILGKKVRYSFFYRLTLELNFVNHILPSGGISGISYFGVRSRSEDISGATSTLAQVSKFLLLYISFLPLLVLGLFFLTVRGHANNLAISVVSSIITLLLVGTVLLIYIIDSRERINAFLTGITRALNWLIQRVRPNRPETINIKGAQKAFNELHTNYQVLKKDWRALRKPILFTLIANITEISALYVVYIAFGEPVNVGAVIIAYAVANFAGLISVLPAGIGVYEGLMTAVLAATGIPASLSIPVTVMYRVITMAIQLIPGYILYQKALKNGLDQKA